MATGMDTFCQFRSHGRPVTFARADGFQVRCSLRSYQTCRLRDTTHDEVDRGTRSYSWLRNGFERSVSNNCARRSASGLLAWTQQELMAHSGVSQKTIADFERGGKRPYPRTIRDFVEAFEKAGIELLQDDGSGGMGLRFKLGFQGPNLRSGTPGKSGTSIDTVHMPV